MKHKKVLSELVKLRNGKKESSVIARPYKGHKHNIIWFLSLTNEETGHKEMGKILGLSGKQIKGPMEKVMKSSYALQYISKEKIGNRNSYINSIPENTDINNFVKETNKTIDTSLVEKEPSFIENLQSLNIKTPYKHGFHCMIYFLQNAGNRGLTKEELLESFGIDDEHLKINPDILDHGKRYIKYDLKNWKNSKLIEMFSSRKINNKIYYFLTQGFDLDPLLFTTIAKGTFIPELEMQGKTKCSTTQIHDRKTSLAIRNDVQKSKAV